MTQKTDITERINSFEDAQKATGRPDVPAFADLPEDLREYFQDLYRGIVINEGINNGWKPDWNDGNQAKYYPWLVYDPSSAGFVFDDTSWATTDAGAGFASRLCFFKTRADAEQAGKTFVDIYNKLLLK